MAFVAVSFLALGIVIGVRAGWHMALLLVRPLPSPWPLLRAALAAHMQAPQRLAEQRRAEWEATRRRYG